ncbi:MAG: hypothetical protein V7711_16140 [Pseudomonadales bacterium]
MNYFIRRVTCLALVLLCFGMIPSVMAQEDAEPEENASNPLSKGRNTDLRAQYFDLGDNTDRRSFDVEGATMLSSQLKLKYELHFWNTDVTGSREQAMETVSLKAIYYAKDRQWRGWGVRPALGLEWIKDFDNVDKGIGGGSDFLSPFVGLAFAHPSGLSLVPLVQHYSEYSGNKVNLTAFRLIGIKSLSKGYWFKLDAKVPFDWENDTVPASAEVQLGRTFSPGLAAYLDGFAGLGSDRPYDWGLGIGLRFVY